MPSFKTKHFLTGEELSQTELSDVLVLAETLKKERQAGEFKKPLLNQSLAMIFEKPSLRTRMSFTVAARELGGDVIESTSQTAKKEEPEDVVRVLAGYCHGIVVRTHDHLNLERMATKSPIPIINGLSDTHHPCQALADLQTLKQVYGDLKGLELAYIGDGNNVLHSLMLLAPYLGIKLRHACPTGYSPSAFIEKRAKARMKEGQGSITACKTPVQAVKGAHAIYTDTWTSMGFEKEEKEREDAFEGYQINEELYSHAAKNAVLMHCLPMVRGKEITDAMADHVNSVLFKQSENRLHAQKALLCGLLAN
jgi:ornithine carbamoyltransferase